MANEFRNSEGFVELKPKHNYGQFAFANMPVDDDDEDDLKSQVEFLEGRIAHYKKRIEDLRQENQRLYKLLNEAQDMVESQSRTLDSYVSMVKSYAEAEEIRDEADAARIASEETIWVSDGSGEAPWPNRLPGEFKRGVGLSYDKDKGAKAYRLSEPDGPLIPQREFQGAEVEIQPGRGFHIGLHFNKKK